MENKILSACMSSRDAYTTIINDISQKDLSELTWIVLELITKYYEADDEATTIDTEVLLQKALVEYPKHTKLLTGIIDGLSVCSIPNVVDYVRRIKIDRCGLRLAQEITSSSPSVERQVELAQEFIEIANGPVNEEVEEQLFHSNWASKINELRDEGKAIKIWPKVLNDYLDGGVCRQHHILLFGRPEVGKSALSITIAAGFASQGFKTIYFGNEDPSIIMKERILGCLTGMSRYEMRDEPELADSLGEENGINNIGFVHLSPGSVRDIEKYVQKYKPDCIVIDQVRNLHVNKKVDSNRIQQLEIACQEVRNIAQRHDCLAVSITQAGNSAHNKNILEMNDIDFSNTGMQAHVDLLVGLGCDTTLEGINQRMLSFPKNKINGKHGHFNVKINPILNRIESV